MRTYRNIFFLLALFSVFTLTITAFAVSSGLDSGPWPMRGHDLRHTGQSEYTDKGPFLKWRYKTDGEVDSSPAIGSDGTVYVGSDNRLYGKGYLYAINPDGSLKWRYKTGHRVFSSPAIGSDGTVYVGSYDNYLYAINPDGSLKWRYQTGGSVLSSPAIGSDGTVYVGSDNRLYAINPDGSLKWRYQTGGSVLSSPAIGSDGTVYVGSYYNYLYAINPDGSLKWRYQTGGDVRSSPAIGSDGTVYVGSYYDGYLYAINPDGSLKWRYQTRNDVYSSPAIGSDGTVYVGSYNNYLYAIGLPQGKGSIYGRVTDFGTDDPIAGATISTMAINTQSGPGGSYAIALDPGVLDPGVYDVTFSKTGYQTITIPNVVVTVGQVTELNIELNIDGPLNIVTTDLPPSESTIDYNPRVRISGGFYPYTYTIAYGSLPPGLSLDSEYGYITGTPTTPGTYTFSIGVTDQQPGYAEAEYTIEVTQPLEFTTLSLLSRATRNQFYFGNIEAIGGTQPYTFSKVSGNIPNGLTLSSNGQLSGTPTTTGDNTFTIRVTDASGRITDKSYILAVDAPLSIATQNLTTAITGNPYTHTLQAAGGYGDYTWNIYSSALPQGIILDSAAGTFSGTPQTASTTPLVFMIEDATGRKAFKNLTLIVTAPLAFATTSLPTGAKNEPYSELVRLNGGLPPYTYSYTGLLPAGLDLNPNTGTISGTPTSAGLTNVQIAVQDSSISIPQEMSSTLSLRVTSMLTITSSAVLPSARLDQAISPVVLGAVGGSSPYQWSIVGGILPSGISLDGSTGQLSGTSTEAGDYVFTVRVTDNNSATADKEFIYHVARTLTIDTNSVPDGGRDTFYSYTVPVSGGRLPYTWRVSNGTLPAGLSLDQTTGTIAGMPTTGQSVQFTLEVSDNDSPAQTAQKTFSINIFTMNSL